MNNWQERNREKTPERNVGDIIDEIIKADKEQREKDRDKDKKD